MQNKPKAVETFEIIMKTAKELAEDYRNGWTGDCNDFVSASVGQSDNLRTSDVEQFCNEFANTELLSNGVAFHITTRGGVPTISLVNQS